MVELYRVEPAGEGQHGAGGAVWEGVRAGGGMPERRVATGAFGTAGWGPRCRRGRGRSGTLGHGS